MAQLKYINAQGEEVSADSPDIAYQVNPDDKDGGADKFIQSIKDKAAREGLAPASAVTSALEVTPETGNPSPLDGVSKASLKKLQDAGLDTMDKIAGAGDDELKSLVSEKDFKELRAVTTPNHASSI